MLDMNRGGLLPSRTAVTVNDSVSKAPDLVTMSSWKELLTLPALTSSMYLSGCHRQQIQEHEHMSKNATTQASSKHTGNHANT